MIEIVISWPRNGTTRRQTTADDDDPSPIKCDRIGGPASRMGRPANPPTNNDQQHTGAAKTRVCQSTAYKLLPPLHILAGWPGNIIQDNGSANHIPHPSSLYPVPSSECHHHQVLFIVVFLTSMIHWLLVGGWTTDWTAAVSTWWQTRGFEIQYFYHHPHHHRHCLMVCPACLPGPWIKQKRYNIKVGNTNLVNIVQRKKCKRYAWGEDIKGHVRTSSAVPPTVTIYLWINSDIIIIIIKMHPYKAQPNWLQMSPISLFIPTSCPSAA